MRGVAVSAAYVIPPVFASTKVIVVFLPGMTGQACLCNLLRRLALETNDLLGIAFFDVCFAWAMTRLAPCCFIFPGRQNSQLAVGRMYEVAKLILVAIFAGLTTNVAVVNGYCSGRGRSSFRLGWLCRIVKCDEEADKKNAKNQNRGFQYFGREQW